MVLTLVDTISTLPSAASPTVTGEWVKHSPLVLGAQVDVFCTDEGTLTVEYSYDGSSVDTSDAYPIANNNWQRIVPVQDLYMRLSYTLTSGIDPTYFRARLYHSDELLETADVQNVAFDSSIALNVSNVDIPLSDVETAIQGVDSNIQVTNTLLGNLSNLDVPLSTVNTSLAGTLTVQDVTAQAILADINANVVANGNTLLTIDTSLLNINLDIANLNTDLNANISLINDKIRVGNEQSLDTSNTLPQTLIYGFHEGHGAGVDDQHPIAVNENGHLFATVETNGTPLDVLNANIDIPLSTVNTTLNGTLSVTDPGLNSNIVLLGQSVYDIESNVRVNGGKLDTINATLSKNLTSAYITNLANTSQLIYTGACTLHVVSYTHNHSSAGVLCIYDASGAVTGSDPPKFVVYMNGGTTDTLSFPVGGMSFTNGIAVRGVTGTSQAGTSSLSALVTSTILYDPA